MIDRKRKFFRVMLGLLYLSTTLFLELGHTDIIEGSFGTVQRLFSHDCAGKEMHRPLGKDDQCPVCARISQTTAHVDADQFSPKQSFQFVDVSALQDSVLRPVRSISVVRGPPNVLA